MPVNWQMGIGQDVGGNAMNALLQGQQAGQQDQARKAMSAYAVNPTPEGLNALAPHNPQFVMQQKQAEAEAEKLAQAESEKKAQESLRGVAKLFNGVGDEATYQQSLAVAQRMGLDVSQAPPNFDANWVQENGRIFNYFAETPGALSTAGKQAIDEGYQPGTPEFHARVVDIGNAAAMKVIPMQPGGGVATYNPMTNQTNVVVQPNDGGAPMGAPAGQPAPAPQAPRGPTMSGGQIEQQAKQLVPGVVVTSGQRSPSHNAAVGGVPGSYHLTGQARDFTPPAGMGMGQLHATLKQAFPGYDVINEGDHVHIEPGPGMARGGGGSKVQQSKSVGGKTYYQIGGKWFDNAEGR